MNGMTFELDTLHERMMATMLAGIARFERDLISERVKSGLAAAKARARSSAARPDTAPNRTNPLPVFLKLSTRDRAAAGLSAIPAFPGTLSPLSSGGTRKVPEAGNFHAVSADIRMEDNNDAGCFLIVRA